MVLFDLFPEHLSSFFISELQSGTLPYRRLDAKRPYLLPSSKPCGPRSSRRGPHGLEEGKRYGHLHPLRTYLPCISAGIRHPPLCSQFVSVNCRQRETKEPNPLSFFCCIFCDKSGQVAFNKRKWQTHNCTIKR